MTAVAPSDALTEEIRAISGVKSVTVMGTAYTIVSTSDSGNMNRIMEVAMRHGGVGNITADKSNLEDVFLTLTGRNLRDGGEG